MGKKNYIRGIIILLTLILLSTSVSCENFTNEEVVISNIEPILNEIKEVKEIDFSGIWKTTLADGSDLKISFDSTKQKVTVTSKERGYTNYPVPVAKYDGQKIVILLQHKLYYEVFVLSKNEDKLSGYYLWDKDKIDVKFKKLSDEAATADARTTEFSLSFEENAKYLKENSRYGKDNTEYNFSYELNNKEKYEDIIEQFDLDNITSGKNDIELMEALLDFVSDNFKHSSYGSLGKVNSLREAMEQRSNNVSLNCKELSYLLAELLRVYGIEAKYIRCFPKDDLFNDCHVVVHAYSEKNKQWVMLDPMYRLILKDKQGNYMNVQSYKRWIIENGDKLKDMSPGDENYLRYSDDAGYTRTGAKFDLYEYSAYMAKNFTYIESSEVSNNGLNWDSQNLNSVYLAPKGSIKAGVYEVVDTLGNKIISTDEEKFFQLPLR